MRFRLGFVLMTGLVAASASPALAQESPRGRGGAFGRDLLATPGGPEGQPTARGAGGALGGFHLIATPAVQKELNLDANQVEKARAASERMGARFESDMKSLQEVAADDRLKRLPKIAQDHYEEGMKALGAFLKPEQLERFDQILFQQRGAAAMLEPSVSRTIKLTPAQARQIAGIVAEARSQQGTIMQDSGRDQAAAAPRLEAVARESNARAFKLLNPQQKKAWEKLAGETFAPKAGPPSAGR